MRQHQIKSYLTNHAIAIGCLCFIVAMVAISGYLLITASIYAEKYREEAGLEKIRLESYLRDRNFTILEGGYKGNFLGWDKTLTISDLDAFLQKADSWNIHEVYFSKGMVTGYLSFVVWQKELRVMYPINNSDF